MWAVRDESNKILFYNKKENAVKEAKKMYNELIKEGYGSIEEWTEEYGKYNYEDCAYEAVMKEIETGDFYDDAMDIFEIETED